MHSAAPFVETSREPVRKRIPRRHVLMLALAVEILAFGVSHADRYQGPAPIAVEAPTAPGHVIV